MLYTVFRGAELQTAPNARGTFHRFANEGTIQVLDKMDTTPPTPPSISGEWFWFPRESPQLKPPWRPML